MIKKKLVIVESPAKAKTIGRYLGSAYAVLSCVGHIRDLPTKSTKSSQGTRKRLTLAAAQAQGFPSLEMAKLVEKMGVDPYHNWEARYEISPDKLKVCAQLRQAAKQAESVYLATDLDREGEAIAWHLREVLSDCSLSYHRIRFSEITPKALTHAVANPSTINMDRVRAQQTRRFLDRLVGYMLSPILWEKVTRGLSAGRVQSPAVRLLTEKEAAIKSFQSKAYWELMGTIQPSEKSDEQVTLRAVKYDEKTLKLENQDVAQAYFQELRDAIPVLERCVGKVSQIRAPAPFITSTLQQTASSKLKLSVKQTMRLAQLLYENGWITYMRTDSTHISDDALGLIRNYITQNFSDSYLPSVPNVYRSRSNAQEAHEAIRPTKTLSSLGESEKKRLGEEAQKLYQLIFNQFLASQMSPASVETTQLNVTAGKFLLIAKGKRIVFDGWTKVLGLQIEDAQCITQSFSTQDSVIQWKDVSLNQHFTRSPNRYSEAALVRELEKRGIGRPSTYASILATIQERGYATIKKRRFMANKLGEVCTHLLLNSFEDLMSYDFTARMEKKLDEIAKGQLDWSKVLSEFFAGFYDSIEKAKISEAEGGMPKLQALPVDWKCPKCQRPMQLCLSKAGPFLGCSGYQLSDAFACKQTVNLVSLAQLGHSDQEQAKQSEQCPVCEQVLEDYWIADTKETVLKLCSGYPLACQHTQVAIGGLEGRSDWDTVILPVETQWPCNLCAGQLILKTGRFGKFAACNTCGQIRKMTQSGQLAPPVEKPIDLPELPCDKHPSAHYVLREGRAGIFLAAHNFPAVRETRSPSVAELKRFKDRLPEKWRHFMTAPSNSPSGEPTFLRFDRRSHRHYIGAKQGNKWTKFVCHYQDGQWVAS